VLLKHTNPLFLSDGTLVNPWYSGYLHMESMPQYIAAVTQVKKGELLGHVGKSGSTTNKHLHFAIYRGSPQYDENNVIQSLSGLTSIDMANQLPEWASKINSWINHCAPASQHHPAAWWRLGTSPCD